MCAAVLSVCERACVVCRSACRVECVRVFCVEVCVCEACACVCAPRNNACFVAVQDRTAVGGAHTGPDQV